MRFEYERRKILKALREMNAITGFDDERSGRFVNREKWSFDDLLMQLREMGVKCQGFLNT